MPKELSPIIEEPFYRNGQKYEITISIDNKHQYICKGKETPSLNYDRFVMVWKYLYKQLHHLRSVADFNIQWELSEYQNIVSDSGCMPQKGYPRYHLHGYVTFHDVFSWLSEQMICHTMKIGSVQLNKMNHKDYNRKKYWHTYINKQKYLMEPACSKRNIPYVITNKTKYNQPTGDIEKYCLKYEYIDDDE